MGVSRGIGYFFIDLYGSMKKADQKPHPDVVCCPPGRRTNRHAAAGA